MEPVIIRETEIVVKSATVDATYGKLVVIDSNNNKINISEKRKAIFAMFQPGATIKLKWGNYQNKDYVADAVQVKPPQQAAQGGQQTASTPKQAEPTVSGPEHGLVLKEAGEMLRAKVIKDTDPLGFWYWKEMNRVAGTGK